jgi:hypothetical protein
MSYSQNLKNETMPRQKILLPEGKRTFTFRKVRYETSKKGNPMFVFGIKDDDTGYEESIYAVDVEGKRGTLKMVLAACGVKEDENGIFNWDNPDVIGKQVIGDVIHEPNDWTDRQGKLHQDKQHKIVDITGLEWKE